jgi:hypothetical protein
LCITSTLFLLDEEVKAMGKARYVVNLTKDEVEYLEGLVGKGTRSARLITRARVLLKAASGCKDAEIMAALDVSDA